MPPNRFRVFATCSIGDPAENKLRELGYDLEVYPQPEPPPKSLILDKVRSGNRRSDHHASRSNRRRSLRSRQAYA